MRKESPHLKKEAAALVDRHQTETVLVITISQERIEWGTAGKNPYRADKARHLGDLVTRALGKHLEASCGFCQSLTKHPTRLSAEQREEVVQIVRTLMEEGRTKGRTLWHHDVADLASKFHVSESTIYNATRHVRPRRWPRGLRALMQKSNLGKSAS